MRFRKVFMTGNEVRGRKVPAGRKILFIRIFMRTVPGSFGWDGFHPEAADGEHWSIRGLPPVRQEKMRKDRARNFCGESVAVNQRPNWIARRARVS